MDVLKVYSSLLIVFDENLVHDVKIFFNGISEIVESGAKIAFDSDGIWCVESMVANGACAFEQHRHAAIWTCRIVDSSVNISKNLVRKLVTKIKFFCCIKKV